MVRRGFTVVEIIITVTIMGILLVLAVVNLNATQVKARDDERKADVEAIASALEIYFRTGVSVSTNLGRYPNVGIGNTPTSIRSELPDVNINSFIAPGATTSNQSFIMATNNVQTTTGVTPQPTINQYVYQPIMGTGALCASGQIDCRKFNLYYRLEGDNTVYQLKSKNQ